MDEELQSDKKDRVPDNPEKMRFSGRQSSFASVSLCLPHLEDIADDERLFKVSIPLPAASCEAAAAS